MCVPLCFTLRAFDGSVYVFGWVWLCCTCALDCLRLVSGLCLCPCYCSALACACATMLALDPNVLACFVYQELLAAYTGKSCYNVGSRVLAFFLGFCRAKSRDTSGITCVDCNNQT